MIGTVTVKKGKDALALFQRDKLIEGMIYQTTDDRNKDNLYLMIDGKLIYFMPDGRFGAGVAREDVKNYFIAPAGTEITFKNKEK